MSTYPLADAKTQWFDDDFSWAIIKPNVLVWHTTEGFGWPPYDGGAKAPHVTAKPDFANKRLKFRQHFANEHSSRALANTAGGVTTNTNNAWQIELVGTCDDAHKVSWGTRKAGVDYIHWPTAPDWALKELALLVKYLNEKFGLPMTTTVEWAGYKSPGGALKNVRLSGAKWNVYTGHCGHQHVPENGHGDPGSFPMQKVLDYAKGSIVPPTPTKTPTSVKITVYPTPTLRGHDITVNADVTPDIDGTTAVQWTTDGKTWNTFGNVATSKGAARIEARPGGDQQYRAVFTPKDTTKYAGSTSAPAPVKVYDLAALVSKIEQP
jgi:hypothetical protein